MMHPDPGLRPQLLALPLLALALAGCGAGEPAGGPDEAEFVVLEQVALRLFEDATLEIETPGAAGAEPSSRFRELVPALLTQRRELAGLGARRALAVTPGERVTIEVQVPENVVLEFGVALDRSASENGSDGMGFEVLADGKSLWKATLGPTPSSHVRAWRPARIPLVALAGKTVKLTFVTDAGPAGDTTADLGGFSGAILKQQTAIARRRSGPEHPNLLLVLVDTLRADALGHASQREGISTPHLDRLADEGFVFERAYSAAPWTMPSVASIFTGKHVVGHGTVGSYQPRLLDEHETLAERLTLMGLATRAFVANPLICKEQNFDQGFGDLVQFLNPRADRMLAAAAEWIEQNGDWQWFAYVHAMDPHDPYLPPPEALKPLLEAYDGPYPVADTEVLRDLKQRGLAGEAEVVTERDVQYLRGLYDAEVTALDASLGALLAQLEERGQLEHTLVVLTSDHGEEFFEHGAFLHGHDLHEELVHVPLIFWGPGVPQPGRTDRPVTLVDLRGTLCGLLGQDPAEAGPSLFEIAADTTGAPGAPNAKGSPLLFYNNLFDADASMDGLRTGPYKVKHRRDLETYELYDLVQDPHERTDLLPQVAPETLPADDPRLGPVRSLAEVLGSIPPPARGLQDAVDPQAQEALRALGYIE